MSVDSASTAKDTRLQTDQFSDDSEFLDMESGYKARRLRKIEDCKKRKREPKAEDSQEDENEEGEDDDEEEDDEVLLCVSCVPLYVLCA